MNELLLMKIITGLFIIVFLFMYVFSKFNLKFTKNSFKGFNSLDEFIGYFRFAFRTVKKHKIIIIFPLIFIIVKHIVNAILLWKI
jgi:hypothetical protein